MFLSALGFWNDHVNEPSNLYSTYQPWQGFVLTSLFLVDPGPYFAPLKNLIVRGRGDVVHMVLQMLADNANEQSDHLAELAMVAIERAKREIGEEFGETDNFESICRISPNEFLETGWENIWHSWMPAVRASLAEAFDSVFERIQPDSRHRVLSVLERLLGDASYQVRRSAARVFSRCDRARFEILTTK